MIVKEIVTKKIVETVERYPVESSEGLKYAIVCCGKVIALFGDKYWAYEFVDESLTLCRDNILELKD